MLRRASGLVGALLGVAVAGASPAGAVSATATPTMEVPAEAVLIPFDPPLDKSVRYRWEASDQRAGKLTTSWSVDSYRFQELPKGYRLTVTPLSSGSDEKDPVKLEAMRRLEELTKRPFVLRLSDEAEIVELERSDEYWARIIDALRGALTKGDNKPTAEESKAIRAVINLFEGMPAEVRLGKLTESVQPIVEFALTESTPGEPIIATIDTPSPFGGTLKQDVEIRLTEVGGGVAQFTMLIGVPQEELQKMGAAMVDKMHSGVLSAEEQTKLKAGLATLKDFKSETVADYKVSLIDGMLESFASTQRISVAEGDKPTVRVRTRSLKRVE